MDFEKLGVFYLGKEFDLAKGNLTDQLVLYDSRDLTTHAVCVGMTGSGKTGLCIDLLEEAAIDGVPALIVDPKGDITNLLLTFPELRPEDFRPWINPDDARRRGLSEDQFASQQAETWKNGLAQWGQLPERIARLREAADFAIYTPGSDAGIPISILQSFAAPKGRWEEEGEAYREEAKGTVSALLGLIGVDADPLRSREHILLANLFEHFWRQGQDLDLAKLIRAIQEPPVRQLGVFDIDAFFPPKERFGLAMLLNNLIASPGFASWLTGQPLEIAGFLATPRGKPRHSIFYIAHLSDAERMFFVTLLLNRIIAWMRNQAGTTSLRALFYMDEIFGFFPPVANPPSKGPMLTLLKQARAFGLGIMLTTQNPVDLDYKGLANAGTWFIGRLQTERDKGRLLEGLQSASAAGSQALDSVALEQRISQLGNRVFLMHNVNEETPLVFQTRWALSYLRGPLTRPQVQQLMGDRQPDRPSATPGTVARPDGPAENQVLTKSPVGSREDLQSSFSEQPPAILPGVRQVFLPPQSGSTVPGLRYQPGLLARARVHFRDARRNVDQWQEKLLLLPLGENAPDWTLASGLPSDIAFTDEPAAGARFEPLPGFANEPKELASLGKSLAEQLYRTCRLPLYYCPALKLYGSAGENERDFGLRIAQVAREQRDLELDKLRERYGKKLQDANEKMQRARATLAKHQVAAGERNREAWASTAESVLGAFLGRRSSRSVSSAMRKYGQSSEASMNAKAAQEDLARYEQEFAQLQEELQAAGDQTKSRWEKALAQVETVQIAPTKSDIVIEELALAWAPS